MSESITVISKKHKNCQPFRFKRVTTHCPNCRTAFKKQRFKILWRDCIECTACGDIFI